MTWRGRLAADVAGWMSSRTQVTAELRAEGQPDAIRLGPDPRGPDPRGPDPRGDDPRGDDPRGDDTGAVVEGTPQRIAGWLTGRVQDQAGLTVTGDLEDLPRWL